MTDNLTLRFKKLHPDAKLPGYATYGSAGMDLYSVINHTLQPDERKTIPTGWSTEIPIGYEMQIRPKSGIAAKHGVTVLNTPGTVDSDYRGEIGVILQNHSKTPYEIKTGEKIAQAVIKKVEIVDIIEATELSDTDRGEGGFGSTGNC